MSQIGSLYSITKSLNIKLYLCKLYSKTFSRPLYPLCTWERKRMAEDMRSLGAPHNKKPRLSCVILVAMKTYLLEFIICVPCYFGHFLQNIFE